MNNSITYTDLKKTSPLSLPSHETNTSCLQYSTNGRNVISLLSFALVLSLQVLDVSYSLTCWTCLIEHLFSHLRKCFPFFLKFLSLFIIFYHFLSFFFIIFYHFCVYHLVFKILSKLIPTNLEAKIGFLILVKYQAPKMQTIWNPPEIREAVARRHRNNVINLITRVTQVTGTHI